MANRETIIGPELRVLGEVRGDDDLVVRGRIHGRIHLTSALRIEAGGEVHADVNVRSLVVSGLLVGNVVAAEGVRLLGKAQVVGDVRTPRFVIDEGAVYKGRVEMGEIENLPRAAPRELMASPSRPSVTRPAPPRLVPPSRGTMSAPRLIPPPAPAGRVTSSASRSASAPATVMMPPRPETGVGVASVPPWAKKKLRRR